MIWKIELPDNDSIYLDKSDDSQSTLIDLFACKKWSLQTILNGLAWGTTTENGGAVFKLDGLAQGKGVWVIKDAKKALLQLGYTVSS